VAFAEAEVEVTDAAELFLVETVAIDFADVLVTLTTTLLTLAVVAAAVVFPLVVAASVVPGWPTMYDGAGLASAGFLSAPVPQGTTGSVAAAPGCVALGGATISPEALSIAQRVVQMRLLGSVACENW